MAVTDVQEMINSRTMLAQGTDTPRIYIVHSMIVRVYCLHTVQYYRPTAWGI